MWQGVILDFQKQTVPQFKVQRTSQRQEIMLSPKTAVMQTTNTGGICWPEKGRAVGNLPNTITKAELLVQTFLRIVLTLLTTCTHLNPKLLITNHLDKCGNLKSQLPPPHTSMLLVYTAPHCGKICQNLRETKSSQPAVLHQL